MKKINILIPCAGRGSRFEQAGYKLPKPLIDVNGKPMIQVVIDNVKIPDAHFIFLVQKDHISKYQIDSKLKQLVPDCTVIEVDGVTEGAACTALLAKELIDNDLPLMIANSDQYVENFFPNMFIDFIELKNGNGGILLFRDTNSKWSFARLNNIGNIVEVAEKNPISDNATVGIYFWEKGSDFVKYANSMIEQNIRVNGEFYICPVYNEAIRDGKTIIPYFGASMIRMHGLGTPEDLEKFLNTKKEE